MTDAPATPQGNVNDLLVLNNGGIERGRASFDVTQVFKANYIYQVPLGAGHRWMSNRFLDRIFGGWATSAFRPAGLTVSLGSDERGEIV
jgi:hypothetical protein